MHSPLQVEGIPVLFSVHFSNNSWNKTENAPKFLFFSISEMISPCNWKLLSEAVLQESTIEIERFSIFENRMVRIRFGQVSHAIISAKLLTLWR